MTSSIPQATKKDIAEKGRTIRMKPRAVLVIGIMLGVLAGFGIAWASFNQTIAGPGPSGTITITPSPITLNSVSMNWATGVLSISLTSTGVASGTCTATFNPGAISTTASYSFTAAATTSFNFNPVTLSQTETSITIQC